MRRVPAVWPLVFFFAFCYPNLAKADPIQVTSGVIEVSGLFDGALPMHTSDDYGLILHGTGAKIVDSLVDVRNFFQLAIVPAVGPEAAVDWSGVLYFQDSLGAAFGREVGPISAPFRMSFAASPTRASGCSNSDGLVCTATAPFTFQTAFTFVPIIGPEGQRGKPEFYQLTGSGTAEGTLFRYPNGEEAADVRYIFAPTPTPEPATLPLIVVGVIGAAVALRRRRSPAHGTE